VRSLQCGPKKEVKCEVVFVANPRQVTKGKEMRRDEKKNKK